MGWLKTLSGRLLALQAEDKLPVLRADGLHRQAPVRQQRHALQLASPMLLQLPQADQLRQLAHLQGTKPPPASNTCPCCAALCCAMSIEESNLCAVVSASTALLRGTIAIINSRLVFPAAIGPQNQVIICLTTQWA